MKKKNQVTATYSEGAGLKSSTGKRLSAEAVCEGVHRTFRQSAGYYLELCYKRFFPYWFSHICCYYYIIIL